MQRVGGAVGSQTRPLAVMNKQKYHHKIVDALALGLKNLHKQCFFDKKNNEKDTILKRVVYLVKFSEIIYICICPSHPY
jgi:hypothetical protein